MSVRINNMNVPDIPGLERICVGTHQVYPDIPEEGPYVVFESDSPRTISPKHTSGGIMLQYSLDGETWHNIASNSSTPEAKTIYMRGQASGSKRLFTANTISNAWSFSGDTSNKLRLYGNLNFLVCDNLGDTNAPTIIGTYCFNSMFYNCTVLAVAPDLPAKALTSFCYNNMFSGCVSLRFLKIHATSDITANSVANMLEGVSSSGVLTCTPALTTDLVPTPEGWTRVSL